VALDHAHNQPHHLLDPGRLGFALGERLAPVLDASLGGQLVEVRARDLDPDLCVGGDVLGDLRARQLDAIELGVTAAS
jgi:hypothetical protein